MKLPRGALDLAFSQALKSNMTHSHGAVIWKSNKILGAGYNYNISVPTSKSRAVSIHSEKSALCGLRGDQIYGANMLAIRVTKAGQLSHGAPCKGCKKLLKRKGIANVYLFDEEKNLCCTKLN